MRMLLLDTKNHDLKEVSPENYEERCKLIGCDTTAYYKICIENHHFGVLADDEATFIDRPMVSAISIDYVILFYGNLLICGVSAEGEYAPLTDEEVLILKNCCQVHPTTLHPEGCLMLTKVYY